MSFQPFVPTGGISGWRFLQNTLEKQLKAHGEGAAIQRDLAYFNENIYKIDTAAELVSDFRLLSVALEAFGLREDIGSKFLIRRVLEEGTLKADALANRLSDKRYRDLSRAFGFGDFATPNTKISDFAERIGAQFKERRFEADMGTSNDTMRLALNARREIPALGKGAGSNRTKWFTLMGTPPLRNVMEVALGLPKSFGTLPIDRQIDTFMERTRNMFGTDQLAELAQPKTLNRVLERYTALDGINGGRSESQISSPALVLLRGY